MYKNPDESNLAMRDVRKRLCAVIDAGKTVAILKRSHPAAILVPLALPAWPTKGETRTARAKALRDFKRALKGATD